MRCEAFWLRAAAAAVLLSMTAACASGGGGPNPTTQETAAAGGGAAPILDAAFPTIAGPKRTVAVGSIDAIGAFDARQGWDVGPAVAAMLNTALIESGRFAVIERAALGQVLTEQELTASGVATGSAAPQPGRIMPAQYLVVGAVTEFSTGDQGQTIGIGGGTGAFGGGLALSGSEGSVALDLRVVNTRTGQVEDAFGVRKTISSRGIGVNVGYKDVALGGSTFWKTPLGEATREALDEAVARITNAVAAGQWEGQVVEVEQGNIIVNAGAEAGLKPGDRLIVMRSTKTLTDPATGQVLGQRRATLGTVTLTSVEPRFASGTYVASEATPPKRGDVVALPF